MFKSILVMRFLRCKCPVRAPTRTHTLFLLSFSWFLFFVYWRFQGIPCPSLFRRMIPFHKRGCGSLCSGTLHNATMCSLPKLFKFLKHFQTNVDHMVIELSWLFDSRRTLTTLLLEICIFLFRKFRNQSNQQPS